MVFGNVTLEHVFAFIVAHADAGAARIDAQQLILAAWLAVESRAAAPGSVGRHRADLHAVDYAAIGLSDLGKPAGFIRRQIEGWWRRWQATELPENPAMSAVHDWLLENQPPEGPASLVHNDYKLDNVMLASPDSLVFSTN